MHTRALELADNLFRTGSSAANAAFFLAQHRLLGVVMSALHDAVMFCAGDSYKATPTEVVPTVVLPPTPPAAAPQAESKADSSKPATAAPPAAAQPKAPSAAAAAPPPQATSEQAAESLISDYGFSKNLAPVAVEEFTGKYRYV